MRIDLELPSLSKQKPTKIIQSFIDINKDYIRYCVEFVAEEWIDESDEMLGKKEEFNFIDVIALKSFISGVELANSVDPPRYRVIIPVNGFGNDIKIYFKKRESAQDLHDKIKLYLLEGKYTGYK